MSITTESVHSELPPLGGTPLSELPPMGGTPIMESEQQHVSPLPLKASPLSKPPSPPTFNDNSDTDESLVVHFKKTKVTLKSPPPLHPSTGVTPTPKVYVNKAAMSARSKRRMSIRRRLKASSPLKKKEEDDDTGEMRRHVERTAHLLANRPTGRNIRTPARRVEKGNPVEDDCSPKLKDKARGSDAGLHSAKKITKNDLAYMLNWDPSKKIKEGSSVRQGRCGMTAIEEETQEEDKKRESTESNETKTITVAEQKDGETETDDETEKAVKKPNPPTPPTSNAGSNESGGGPFDSLIAPPNMFYVNNKPYAKLGVIGRGGSCKVYRVLSPTYQVLALKKVKIEGMDKKSIDSYANEIELLKGLKGNPAIIQLEDSEVDLERKCIMIGETQELRPSE
jgi:hypothetical protein